MRKIQERRSEAFFISLEELLLPNIFSPFSSKFLLLCRVSHIFDTDMFKWQINVLCKWKITKYSWT